MEILSTTNIAIYLLIMNVLGFLSMGIDKSLAKHHMWRISEEALFVICALGGGIGSIAGMYLFHHKTKKTLFTIGMPVICVLEYVAIIVLKFVK